MGATSCGLAYAGASAVQPVGDALAKSRKLSRRIVEAIAPFVGYAYLKTLRLTLRLEYRNRDALARAREIAGQYILSFWHSRFVMMRYAYPDRRLVVLHSEHGDARMVARMMRWSGLAQAWGSSSRGGAQGVRQILRLVKDGHDVGLTPDGPRGPRRRVQPGVIAVARLSGKPIVPVGFSARPFRRLRSWDGTLLPLPFGRGIYVYGEPIIVPRGADETEQERLRAVLEDELDRLTDEADRAIGIPLEAPRVEDAA
ncbi:MAG: lysophospholipid acyltransferase family protein [bacterium]|nr:lysophospholipid acyltransferase family protein [bacterium]